MPNILDDVWLQVSTTMSPDSVDAAQRATAWLGWRGAGMFSYGTGDNRDDIAAWVRLALIACTVLVLLICALGQWLISAEQIGERRRACALARASGVPTAVLGQPVVLTAVLPVVVGQLAVGAGLSAEVKYIRDGVPVSLGWGWVALSTGIALAITLVIAFGSALRLRRTRAHCAPSEIPGTSTDAANWTDQHVEKGAQLMNPAGSREKGEGPGAACSGPFMLQTATCFVVDRAAVRSSFGVSTDRCVALHRGCFDAQT